MLLPDSVIWLGGPIPPIAFVFSSHCKQTIVLAAAAPPSRLLRDSTDKRSGTKHLTGMTYEEMIIEAIMAHGDDARSGLGRPTLKKYILMKYPDTGKLPLASFNSHLNQAIVRGKDKGVFLLPKGVSGKIKLAAKAKHAADKSNAKMSVTKKAAPKKKTSKPDAAMQGSQRKTKSSTTKRVTAKKPSTSQGKKTSAPSTKAKSAAKKGAASSSSKKAAATTKATASKKGTVKTKSSASSGKKAAPAKKATAKVRTPQHV